MANSKITLDFTGVPSIGDLFSFRETLQDLVMLETFKALRTTFYQCKVPHGVDFSNGPPDPPIWIYSEFISQRYKQAFDLDYNTSGLFTVTAINGASGSGLGTVIIEANYENAFFEEVETPAYITATIENQDPVIPFTIDNVDISGSLSAACANVQISVEASEDIVAVISPTFPNDFVISNPLVFEWPRNQTLTVTVENADGLQATTVIQTPQFLSLGNFNIQVNNGPAGGTIVVNSQNSNTLNLEYSLDNITWQSDNVFGGLAVDDYTLYVRDQYGCSFSMDFHIDEFGIQSPYFYYSKANSVRMANRIVWGDAENYKTDENTLSCEADVELPKKEIQLFQTADVVTCQFRSNYAVREVKVIKEDLTEDTIAISQKTNFIGLKDKRDAIKFDAGNGKTGIYFTTGNVYDYVTGTVTGTHQLNGMTPEWARANNYFQIGGFNYLIEQIYFDEARNADVVIFSNVYVGAEMNVIVGSIYNNQNFEVYEFTIDMVNYIDQYIQIRLVNSDPHFPTVTYLSELIQVKVRHLNTLEIRYRNATNTDVMYSTGIEHKIRVKKLKVNGKADEENEIHKTDSDVKLLNADLYEGDEFQFEPLTKEMWRKLMIGLSHEIVFINGVSYAKNGQFSTEGPLGQTNWYVLTANMLKNANVYNSITSGDTGLSTGFLQIPGIINADNDFLEY